eukprot:2546015-Rhodomonas_salina.1
MCCVLSAECPVASVPLRGCATSMEEFETISQQVPGSSSFVDAVCHCLVLTPSGPKGDCGRNHVGDHWCVLSILLRVGLS